MKRHIAVFLVMFVIGASGALVVRTMLHDPHAEAPLAAEVRPAAPQVSASAVRDEPPPAAVAAPAPAKSEGAVNSVCALCGMDVDPSIPFATYQGRKVGFGCAACPARFAREPDRYGPYALRNEVAPR